MYSKQFLHFFNTVGVHHCEVPSLTIDFVVSHKFWFVVFIFFEWEGLKILLIFSFDLFCDPFVTQDCVNSNVLVENFQFSSADF